MTSFIRTLRSVPSVSVLERFDCNYLRADKEFSLGRSILKSSKSGFNGMLSKLKHLGILCDAIAMKIASNRSLWPPPGKQRSASGIL